MIEQTVLWPVIWFGAIAFVWRHCNDTDANWF